MANHTHIYIRHAKQFPFHVNRHTDLGEEGRGVRKKKKENGEKKTPALVILLVNVLST